MKTSTGFTVKYIFLAYVPPKRDDDKSSPIRTETLNKANSTTAYLLNIFDNSRDEAKVEIMFVSDDSKNNDVRTDILNIAERDKRNQKVYYSKKLAERLHEITDKRNGTGLFIIMQGIKEGKTRMVLIRFKGMEGLVNNKKKSIVDYMSEVFTKRSNHYKLAIYEDVISKEAFWQGYSVDKQLSSTTYKTISMFWVESFLESETALTAKQGTMQFSKILKDILTKTTDIVEQEQILSGIVNLRSKRDPRISISDFCKNYLTEDLGRRIKDEYGNDDFYNSVFRIDRESYNKEFGKTVVSMDNGITAYVPTFSYDKYVKETENTDGSKSITITGKLSGKRINKQQNDKLDKNKTIK